VFEPWYDPTVLQRAYFPDPRIAVIVSEAPPNNADVATPPRAATSSTGRGSDAPSPTPRVISSDALLAGASQLAILHKQTVYFLRQTRFGKLILTK
jgi:hemin uptake protein HemP